MTALKIKNLTELEKRETGSKWLVEGFWLNQGIGMLAAQPKTGKSWTAMDLAISVATGKPFLNKFEVNEAQRVLVFFAEDTQAIQEERIQLIKAAKGIADNIPNLGIVVSEQALRLDTAEGVAALRAAVESFRPSLLILDPFIRMHQISESDSTAVAGVLSPLRKLKDEFGCGVLMVHHATKGSKNLRGSTEFAAWGETNLFMYKDKAENVFIDIQHRAAESIDGQPLKIGKIGDGTTIFAVDQHEIVEEKQEESQISSQVFENLADKIVSAIRRYPNPSSLEQIAERTGASVSEVRGELYGLIKQNEVLWTKQGYKLH